MKLSEHLALIEKVETPDEMDSRLEAAYKDFPGGILGRTWVRIKRARWAGGDAMVLKSPAGPYVPTLGRRRLLSLCGQTYSVGYGGNSTAERYSWLHAKQWSVNLLTAQGISEETAESIWSWHSSFPHRALRIAEEWLKGV